MNQPTRRQVMIGALGALVLGPRLFTRFSWAEDPDEPTADNIEGPFYKPDAPWRSKLRVGDEGEALVVRGTVFGPGKKPLEGAVVDVWHADAKGEYDNEKFAHRGRVKTDKEGRYSIETLVPGRYAIDDEGKKFRPSHIHYKVSCDGHKTLTTQLYFKGDPHLEKDPFMKKSLVREVTKKDGKGSVQFDVKLRAAEEK
ncbi:MAG: carboxypeptidase regulatory-like domain-containing protein [Planctomycetota bacterium]